MRYAGSEFYYQPNGDSCYLYAHEHDVGNPAAAMFSPAATSVTLPAPTQQSPIAPPPPRRGPWTDAFSAQTSLIDIESYVQQLRHQ